MRYSAALNPLSKLVQTWRILHDASGHAISGLMTEHFAKLVHHVMSKTVQPVLKPASDAIPVGAWYAGQRIALPFRSANPAAAAVNCVVIPDRDARFKPSPGALYLHPDPCSVRLRVL
jgi:hypothetical protein